MKIAICNIKAHFSHAWLMTREKWGILSFQEQEKLNNRRLFVAVVFGCS